MSKGKIHENQKSFLCLVILLCIFFTSCSNTKEKAPTDLKVNLLDNPIGVDLENIHFSWVMNDDDSDEYQSSYRIRIAESIDGLNNKCVYDTDWIKSNNNTSVQINDLNNYFSENHLYYWNVATKDKNYIESNNSKPSFFITKNKLEDKRGIWRSTSRELKSDDDFCFVKVPFKFAYINDVEKVVLSATALSPEPSRQFVFNIFVNDNHIGMGPTRIGKNQDGDNILYYNNYDITDNIIEGKISLVLYYIQQKNMSSYFKLRHITKMVLLKCCVILVEIVGQLRH